jgi:hypothetical protein
MAQPSITIENLKKFKTAYNAARKGKKEQFEFEGAQVLTSYAKYVIEYFEKIRL